MLVSLPLQACTCLKSMPCASLDEAVALGTSQPANWTCNKTTAILSQVVCAVCIAACAAQAFGATQLLVGTWSFYNYSVTIPGLHLNCISSDHAGRIYPYTTSAAAVLWCSMGATAQSIASKIFSGQACFRHDPQGAGAPQSRRLTDSSFARRRSSSSPSCTK